MKPDLQRRIQRYGWDKAAEFYEDSWKVQLKPAQDKLLEMADLKPGEKVLETACGTGLITLRAAKAVEPEGSVLATDISEGMIEMVKVSAQKKKIHNIVFGRMDAEKLDLDSDQFDAALCGFGLMYVPDPVESLKEMYRVLKPGGRAGIAVWGERKNCGWADIFPIVDKQVASDVCPMFFQQGTGSTLEYSMRKAGFVEIRLERLHVTLNYSTPEEALIAAFSGGPVALAYKNFNEKTRDMVHREYLDSISSFKNKTGYKIPGEFVVACGNKEPE